MPEYIKDFDRWNIQKKLLDGRMLNEDFFFLEGEIWWISMGINVAEEIDGKHESFERPVLVFKKFTDTVAWVIPITSKQKDGSFYRKIVYEHKTQTLAISQMRLVSLHRFLRLVCRLDESQFSEIKQSIINIVHSITKIPPQ